MGAEELMLAKLCFVADYTSANVTYRIFLKKQGSFVQLLQKIQIVANFVTVVLL